MGVTYHNSNQGLNHEREGMDREQKLVQAIYQNLHRIGTQHDRLLVFY